MDWDKQQSSASDINRDYVTSIETISGNGHVLPPMLVAQGSVHLEKWYTQTSLPDEYVVGLSNSGYANDTLSIEWLKYFDIWTSQRQVGAWRLLIFDGYGSHTTKEFLDYCDDCKIICLSLPPHSSQHLQPLDVVCFQPFKHHHKAAVEQATRTGCTDFNKLEFFNAIKGIRETTFKRNTILSAWRKTGIWPWCPELVLQKVRAVTPTPPPTNHPSSPAAPSPRNYTEFKTELHKIRTDIEAGDVDQERLLRLLGYASTLTDQASIMEQELAEISAVIKARKDRQKPGRRQVQRGSVLTAASARLAVDSRVRDEAERAGKRAARAYKKAQNQPPAQPPSPKELISLSQGCNWTQSSVQFRIRDRASHTLSRPCSF